MASHDFLHIPPRKSTFSGSGGRVGALLPLRAAAGVALGGGRLRGSSQWDGGGGGGVAAVSQQQQAEAEAQEKRQQQVVLPVGHLWSEPRATAVTDEND